jgi:hypothetical protein
VSVEINNIKAAMECFYSVKDMTVGAAKTIIKAVEIDLLSIYPDLAAHENDYRLGNDTYGYEEDKILVNLQYISDRWQSAFRVAWMLGLVNEDYRGHRIHNSPEKKP